MRKSANVCRFCSFPMKGQKLWLTHLFEIYLLIMAASIWNFLKGRLTDIFQVCFVTTDAFGKPHTFTAFASLLLRQTPIHFKNIRRRSHSGNPQPLTSLPAPPPTSPPKTPQAGYSRKSAWSAAAPTGAASGRSISSSRPRRGPLFWSGAARRRRTPFPPRGLQELCGKAGKIDRRAPGQRWFRKSEVSCAHGAGWRFSRSEIFRWGCAWLGWFFKNIYSPTTRFRYQMTYQ